MRPLNVLPNPSRNKLKSAEIISPLNASSAVPGFSLEQNSPNPVSTETEIRFTLPEDSQVQLKLYSIMGIEVKIVPESFYPAGTSSIW